MTEKGRTSSISEEVVSPYVRGRGKRKRGKINSPIAISAERRRRKNPILLTEKVPAGFKGEEEETRLKAERRI